MKFTIPKQELSQLLSIVKPAVGTRTTLPFITSFKITASEATNQLSITGTDLQLTVQVIPVTATDSPTINIVSGGSILLPAQLFTSLISNMPDADVTISVSDNLTASISCGNFKTKMKGYDSVEFPMIAEMPENCLFMVFPQDTLSRILRSLVVTASSDQSRQSLNSIRFLYRDPTEPFRIYSTDGYRAGCITFPFLSSPETFDVLLPVVPASIIEKIYSNTTDVSFTCTANQAFFSGVRSNGTTILVVTQLMDLKYPDIASYFRKELLTSATSNVTELTKATKTALLFTKDAEHGSINIKINAAAQTITLGGEASELGSSEAEIPATVVGESDLDAHFGGTYLTDVFTAANSTDITIKTSGDKTMPIMAEASNDLYQYQCVIMPRAKN